MSQQYGANTYLPPSPVIPQFLVISEITRSNPMIVTVITPNVYIPGQKCYFSIPFDYGMFQLNGLTGQILAVGNTNLSLMIDINSSQFDTFVLPTGGEQPATLSPAGSRNIYQTTTVPFHSLDGSRGN